MNISDEAILVDSQIDDSQVDIFTFNDRPSRVIRTLSGDRLNPKGAFVTLQVLSSSEHPGNIEVYRVPFRDKMLIRCERLLLPVTKSECGNYFMVESEDLDMSLSEESLKELKKAFDFMLQMTWEEYVMGDDKKMTKGALKIRDHLIKTYRCV